MSDSSRDPLGPLAGFAGLWRGKGAGHYATIDSFTYDEELELTPSGKPFLFYRSKTQAPDGSRAMHTETGYLRLAGRDHIELLVAQPTGFLELQRAPASTSVLDFTQHVLGVSPDAKQVHAVRRRRLDGAGDRTRDVVELQVQEDALPARGKLPEQWGPGPGEEWGSDFVPANRVAQSIDEPQGFLARGEVERNDEVGHVFSNLPVQPTRPAPISSLRSAMPATSP